MFDTVGDAVEFAKETGEVEISPADKNVFRLAMAIYIAYTKGQLSAAENEVLPNDVEDLEKRLEDLRSEYQAL